MAALQSEVLPTSSGVTVIERKSDWVSLDLRELWSYRELAYFFVWRDLKVRYKQTAFGLLWAVLQPVLLMLVLTVAFGRIGGVSQTEVPYPLFALAGLVPWTLFAQSLIGSSDSLVEASNLLQKVYFPRLLLPIAAVGSFLVDFGFALIVLFALMLIYGVGPSVAMLWIIPLTLLALATSLAVGIWLAAVNVRYRDVRYAVPFLAQLWLFASPVAYSGSVIPPEWRGIYYLNPMAGVIDGFRWAILAETSGPPVEGLLASVAVTLAVLILGVVYFRRVERTFADVI
jgi:lipopolysaccharide transport system permease protein